MKRDMLIKSPSMQRLMALVDRVGPTSLPVLIEGESGVGKELVAETLHRASGRHQLVALNCAALPAQLVESELFGHRKGAFTGAAERSAGYFVEADRGTLFLDEVGELDLALQAKLLRALEDGLVRPVGGGPSTRVDARVVAATNRDLRAAVQERRFRPDLYHRLAGVVLHVPPLRERRDEIVPLVELFIDQAARGGARPQVSTETMATLLAYDWPGNVRELKQAVQRAVVLGGEVLTIEDFLLSQAPTPVPSGPTAREAAIVEAIRRYGSIRAAARALGVPHSTLFDRARAAGIPPLRSRHQRPDQGGSVPGAIDRV